MTKNIFSENRGILSDGVETTIGLDAHTKQMASEDIRDGFARDGVLLMSDCNYCGIQWRGIIKWPEVMGFFLGQQVPGTQSIRSGIAMQFACRRCHRTCDLKIGWDELDRYVAAGVRGGFLPTTIYQAREQVARERAAAAAKAPRR